MNRSLATALTFALATACAAPLSAMETGNAATRNVAAAGNSAARPATGAQLSAKNQAPKPPVLILALVGIGLAGLIVMQRKSSTSS